MKFGIFSISQVPDQSQRVQAFDDDMRQFKLADDLGYDTIWIAEHLFSTYCIVNSAQVLAAAIARTTKRIKIGTSVVVIPFNHPLRTAGDFALIDILSHGRLLFGVGRAYNPAEFGGLNLPLEKSREMFIEGMNIIAQAWGDEAFTYEGEFWTIPQKTQSLPKPVQQPHPPIYCAVTSTESFDLAARNGWNIELAATFSYRFYRDEWLDKLEGLLKGYEKARENYGTSGKSPERMLMIPFFVDESADRAIKIHGKHVQWFLDKLKEVSGSAVDKPKIVKGYELSGTQGPKTVAMGFQTYEKMLQFGAAIAGDPDTCIRQLRMIKDRLGITEFCLWFDLGGIDSEAVERSMRLAKEKVFPYV